MMSPITFFAACTAAWICSYMAGAVWSDGPARWPQNPIPLVIVGFVSTVASMAAFVAMFFLFGPLVLFVGLSISSVLLTLAAVIIVHDRRIPACLLFGIIWPLIVALRF